MHEGFCAVVDGIDDTERVVAENAADVHDRCCWFGFEVGKESHCEMHRPGYVDCYFGICFREIEVVDVEGSLNAGIVDYAVDVWMFFYDGSYEIWNGFEVSGIKNIVRSILPQFLRCSFELLLCSTFNKSASKSCDEKKTCYKPTMITFFPSEISRWAMAFPIPPPPPVTRAHLKSRVFGAMFQLVSKETGGVYE